LYGDSEQEGGAKKQEVANLSRCSVRNYVFEIKIDESPCRNDLGELVKPVVSLLSVF
jgi:hypothetical protein